MTELLIDGQNMKEVTHDAYIYPFPDNLQRQKYNDIIHGQ